MILTEETSVRKIETKSGNIRSYRFALFECPICKKHIELSKEKGKKQNSCGSKECVLKTRTHNKNSGHSGAKKHGFSSYNHEYHGFYRIWKAMKSRCYSQKDTSYKRYGLRGITVSKEWMNFDNFKKDMLEEYIKQMNECDKQRKNIPSIDRIDNDGNYSKENCEWIPFKENVNKDKRIPVNQLDLNGKIINRFNSASQAAKEIDYVEFGAMKLKVHFSSILKVCNGKSSHHVGYNWEFATDKVTLQ